MKVNKSVTIAILSISAITVMASAAVSPALANIGRAFPDAGTNLIKTVLTLPSLFIIPFSLISGKLVYRFGNKRVLIVGILIYIFGGVAPVSAGSINELLFYRAVLGCGCGLIMPISQSLIALNYKGTLKTRITGYSGAASYLMGVIASFVVAPVSSIDWHYSFYIYLIAVIVLVLNIVLLPGDKPKSEEMSSLNKRISGRVWWIIAGVFVANVAFYAVPANVALFMKEQQIGEPQSAGTVISVFMIAGFIAGLTLSRIQRYTRTYVIVFGTGIMASGYILLSLAYDLLPVITGSGLVGFAFGILFPSFMILITNRCSGHVCVYALSFAGCAQFSGQFVSPYLLQLIKNIMHLPSLRSDFTILAVSLSVATVIYFTIKQVIKYRLIH